jgi:hypothetical protein
VTFTSMLSRVAASQADAGDRRQDEVAAAPAALAERLARASTRGILLHRLLNQMIDHLDQLDAGSDRADQPGRSEPTEPKAAS